MTFPSVLFVSSCDFTPASIIEKVLNRDLADPVIIDPNISAYPWHIDNKYYSTDVNLCAVHSKAISNEDFASSVDAVIICFDAANPNGLEAAESWLPFLSVYDADIKILVCKTRCEDEGAGVSNRSAQEWCVQRGFELVELEPNLEDVDPEDDFPETVGVERIRQALNAHHWANLVLKAERGSSLRLADSLDDPVPRSNGHVSDALAESLEELLEGDSFGDLFSQLTEMKSRVATLSGAERKDAAEQVVRAFWNAMGGEDSDEI